MAVITVWLLHRSGGREQQVPCVDQDLERLRVAPSVRVHPCHFTPAFRARSRFLPK
jgi:hypothetical protein